MPVVLELIVTSALLPDAVSVNVQVKDVGGSESGQMMGVGPATGPVSFTE